MIRILFFLAALAVIAGCNTQVQDKAPESLGEFSLGHNIVVASKMKKGPISRDATEEEWTSTLTSAVANRFGLFEGEQLYHFGISVEGFMLAPEGVPLIYNPRSMLILNVTVWDDAAGKKLNGNVHQITVVEDTTQNTFLLGSGRERTKQQQMDGLAANAMDQLGEWLVEQNEQQGWFVARPETVAKRAAAEEASSSLSE